MEKIILYGSLLIALLAFAFAAWLYLWVKRQPCENQKIIKACGLIRAGARTFLRKEYAVLAKFAGVAAVLILVFLPTPIWKGNWLNNVLMMVAYIFGTGFSAIAGKIGLEVATIANGRSAEAAKKGIKPSFMAGFRGGAVMGMAVVGASLLGVTVVYLVTKDPTTILGFSFGASSLALFAKAGGASSPRRRISAPTSSAKSSLAFRKTILATPPSLPITLATTLATWPAWARTSSIPTWLPWLRLLLWAAFWMRQPAESMLPWYSALRRSACLLRSSAL